MYTVSLWDQGPVCPDRNQQLLPAVTRTQTLKEFVFGLMADVSVAAVYPYLCLIAQDGLA